jgi:hypothetical protein
MKKQTRRLVLIGLLCLPLTGCVTSPERERQKATALTLNVDLNTARQTTHDALKLFGFEVEQMDSAYLEGSRPRTRGLFMASGGEQVKVWLESIDQRKTQIFVRTFKTAFGLFYQRSWEEDIVQEIQNKSK